MLVIAVKIFAVFGFSKVWLYISYVWHYNYLFVQLLGVSWRLGTHFVGDKFSYNKLFKKVNKYAYIYP